jgi:O-antigen/teichoic acid export membrane protein
MKWSFKWLLVGVLAAATVSVISVIYQKHDAWSVTRLCLLYAGLLATIIFVEKKNKSK